MSISRSRVNHLSYTYIHFWYSIEAVRIGIAICFLVLIFTTLSCSQQNLQYFWHPLIDGCPPLRAVTMAIESDPDPYLSDSLIVNLEIICIL
jgi:hypothetical protein